MLLTCLLTPAQSDASYLGKGATTGAHGQISSTLRRVVHERRGVSETRAAKGIALIDAPFRARGRGASGTLTSWGGRNAVIEKSDHARGWARNFPQGAVGSAYRQDRTRF